MGTHGRAIKLSCHRTYVRRINRTESGSGRFRLCILTVGCGRILLKNSLDIAADLAMLSII